MWSLIYLSVHVLVALIIGTSRRGHHDGAKDLEMGVCSVLRVKVTQ